MSKPQYHPPTSPHHPSHSRFAFPPLELNAPVPKNYLTHPAGYHTGEFVVGASCIAFHIPTARVVIVHDQRSGWWFLPKGRKDVGESVEVAAVREGFEESGYKSTLLSYPSHTRQPPLHRSPGHPHTEPFHLHLSPIYSKSALAAHLFPHPHTEPEPPQLYLLHYFLTTLGTAEPVRAENWKEGLVGAHEVGYESYLVGIGEAVGRLSAGRFEYVDGVLRVARGSEASEAGAEGKRFRHSDVPEPDEEGWIDEEAEEVAGSYNGRRPGEEVRMGDVPASDNKALEALLVVEGWKAIAPEAKVVTKESDDSKL